MDEITIIKTEYGDFHNCNNCGAFALRAEDIGHHEGCTPGEAAYWADFYEKAALEEEREAETAALVDFGIKKLEGGESSEEENA